ncbi:hypothetical protein PFISCL1PPCAC_18458, partial [Pristionchus fissidentatus]
CMNCITIDYTFLFFVCAVMQCVALIASALCAQFWPMGYPSAIVALILFSIGQMWSLIAINNKVTNHWTAIAGLLFAIAVMARTVAMEVPLGFHVKEALRFTVLLSLLTLFLCAAISMKPREAFGGIFIFMITIVVFIGIWLHGVILRQSLGDVIGTCYLGCAFFVVVVTVATIRSDVAAKNAARGQVRQIRQQQQA